MELGLKSRRALVMGASRGLGRIQRVVRQRQQAREFVACGLAGDDADADAQTPWRGQCSAVKALTNVLRDQGRDLLPRTGQTHQLRVHMNALGVPLLGDPLYPEVTPPVPAGDFRRPLQLLARTLEFTDPVTGVEHRFRSGRVLAAWDRPEDRAAGQ